MAILDDAIAAFNASLKAAVTSAVAAQTATLAQQLAALSTQVATIPVGPSLDARIDGRVAAALNALTAALQTP